jgi:outer membrane lipoprotein-sorting protein
MLRKTILGALAGALFSLAAAAQTADEIIAKNVAARGGLEKIKAVKSAIFSGRMSMGEGMDAPIVLKWKRPDRVRMEFTLQGMTGVQAYDGSTGWQIMPFLGKKDAETMTAEDLKDVQEQADAFEGPLVDYAAKGHQVELLGKEAVEGTDAYKLKLTKKNGEVTTYYLDAEAFLEIKTEAKRNRRGQEMEFESAVGDYKEVGGILFPHSIEVRPKGGPQSQIITIEKIELDQEIADSEFAMPAPKPEEKPAN